MYDFLLTPVGLNYDPQASLSTTKGRVAFMIYRMQQTLRIPLMVLNLLAILSNIVWG